MKCLLKENKNITKNCTYNIPYGVAKNTKYRPVLTENKRWGTSKNHDTMRNIVDYVQRKRRNTLTFME